MSSRFEVADVTVAQSVAANSPAMVTLPWPGGIVRKITVVIPDGHAGLTGIALGYGNQPVLPRSPGAFISGNDEVIPIELSDTVPGVPWQVFMCNLDLAPHTFEVRFELDEVSTLSPTQYANAVEAAAVYAVGVTAGG